MAENKTTKSTYFSAGIGAVVLMLLRICDRASILSAALALIGMTALLYGIRHAHSLKGYLFLAGMTMAAYEVRFYGYTGEKIADLLLGLLVGLIMFALMAAERLFRKFGDTFWYTLFYPAIYMGFLYFTEILKINMPFRMDTYLSCIPALCQITVLFGIYFLDFLIAWTASVLAFFPDHRASRQGLISAGIYACALCGILCFGFVHLDQRNAAEVGKEDTVRIACSTGPYYGSFSEASYAEFTLQETLDSLSRVVRDAAEEEAEILLFSEEAYCVWDKEEAVLLEEAEKLAAEHDMHLLLAYEVDDSDDSENGKGINKLCWISGEGEIVYEYTKHCLVPIVETAGYVRGEQMIKSFAVNVHGKTLEVASAICYDADFELFMSHMGKHIDLLLLPTWDWDVIAEEHFSVARLRAIASETTLVRSVYDGWNAVIDSAGNVLMRVNTNDHGYENILIYDVPVR